jgi:hypothetical protein
MDQMTQQNAALVEEMAAAANSLQSQAQGLVQTVATFKLPASSGTQQRLAVTKRAPKRVASIARPAPAAAPRPALSGKRPSVSHAPAAPAAPAKAQDADDWESF